jgi:amino acid permease
MFKTQVGIGVLQLPKAFSTLGLLPGIICFLFLAIVANWLGYQIGKAASCHPHVRSFDDVGKMMFGRAGRVVCGAAYFLCKFAIYLLHMFI